jgi:hypothetical protein
VSLEEEQESPRYSDVIRGGQRTCRPLC